MPQTIEHHTHQNPRGGSVNIVGGQAPEGALKVATLESPAPAPNPEGDPEGAKIVLEAKDVQINGATLTHADLNVGGDENQLGALGAPGVETPESDPKLQTPEADATQIPGGDYGADEEGEPSGPDFIDPEADEEEPPVPSPVTRRRAKS